jgi:hypothetical protein
MRKMPKPVELPFGSVDVTNAARLSLIDQSQRSGREWPKNACLDNT